MRTDAYFFFKWLRHPVQRRGSWRRRIALSTKSGRLFFVERNGKAFCVICHETVSVLKTCNVKRHFSIVHAQQAALPEEKKQSEFARLSAQLQKQSAFMKRTVASAHTDGERNTRASYRVAYLVAKHLKSFTDGEFFKDCGEGSVS